MTQKVTTEKKRNHRSFFIFDSNLLNPMPMKIDDLLLNALQKIKDENDADYLNEIIILIQKNELYRSKIDEILLKFKMDNPQEVQLDFLDLILQYIEFVLEDDLIEETEYYNVTQLKHLFQIKVGDFYTQRHSAVQAILKKQLLKIYEDQQLDRSEIIHQFQLQGLFDLSYDQFSEFIEA